MTTLSTAARNAAANAVTALADAGVAAGSMQIRTGVTPGAGTLLATLPLSDPAFAAAAAGVATLDVTPVPTDASADAAGDAGHFTILDSDSNLVFSGTVTATGGGGDITFPTVTFAVGMQITLTSFTLTVPA